MLVVNRRMSARQLVAHVRSHCRRHNLTLQEFIGRRKGSHRVYLVLNRSGHELGRITVTDHPGDLSWAVLRDIEGKLAHLFGDRWTEQGQ